MDPILTDDYFPSTDSSTFELVCEKESLRPGVIMKVRGPIGITETENRNGRVYTNEFWDSVLNRDDVQVAIKERALVGAADHPADKFVPPLSTVSHVMTSAWVDKNKKALMAESEVLDTPMGRIVSTLLKANVKLGASTRGGGNTVQKEGKQFVSEKGYKWGGFDFVFEPSAQNAYPRPVREQIEKIILESSPDSFKEDPDYFKRILEKLGCNGDLILERVKQPQPSLNESSSKDALVIEELKKEVEALRKKTKSLEETLSTRDSELQRSKSEVVELKDKISVLVESVQVTSKIETMDSGDSLREEMQNLETLYDVVQHENANLISDIESAITLAKAKRTPQVVIESHAADTSIKEGQGLARLLQYGRKISSLIESNSLLSKKVEELTDARKEWDSERRKLISEKASLYSRLNLALEESAVEEQHEEDLFEEEDLIHEETPKPVLVHKGNRPRIFEGALHKPIIGGLQVIHENVDLQSATKTSRADSVCDIIKKI
jgi:hypothetical protein